MPLSSASSLLEIAVINDSVEAQHYALMTNLIIFFALSIDSFLQYCTALNVLEKNFAFFLLGSLLAFSDTCSVGGGRSGWMTDNNLVADYLFAFFADYLFYNNA